MKIRSAILFLFILFIYAGCGITKVDHAKGKQLCENFLDDLKNENYEGMDKYFTPSFNENEPLENKISKFQKIRDAAGQIQSFELLSEDQKYDDVSAYHQLKLEYKVNCSRIPLKFTFIVVNHEGKTRMIFQNIENWEP